jgi:DNA-binding Xre family transcriptional regulator
MTKLANILNERGMTQRDLQRAIVLKFDFKIGDDRISKLYNGKVKNYQLRTAKIIAETLGVKIDDISEV